MTKSCHILLCSKNCYQKDIMLCILCLDPTNWAPWPLQERASAPERCEKKAGYSREQRPVELNTGEKIVEFRAGGRWWEISTFSDSRSGRQTSPVCGPGEQNLGNPGGALPLSHSSSPFLSALRVLCCPRLRSSVGKKHYINNKIIKGMSVSEQKEGGGMGNFGSTTPSSRASVLPSTHSSLNPMGLEIGAGGTYRDPPT